MEQLIYLNALKLVDGIGTAKLARLLEFFHSAKRVWRAGRQELELCLGHDRAVDSIFASQKTIDPEREWEKLTQQGIKVTAPHLPDYPANLASIYQPPLLLYYKGDLQGTDLSLAIVGSRMSTPYGRAVAEGLARDLAKAGFAVVSGLARGIDATAHRGALGEGGKTIAVLGSGLDIIYPREHRSLYAQITESGGVISEYPLGTPPHSGNFPVRNRIISGISLGTLVVESRAKSGSLITADFALEQGRDVFAVPGPINAETSRGPHKLIKQGAKLVETAEDVIEEYLHLLPKAPQLTKEQTAFSQEHQRLMKILSLEPLHIDSICRQLQTTPEQIAGLLVHLELAGQIRQLNGGYYVINFT